MKSSTKDEAQGVFHQEKRHIKECVGKNCNNVGMEAVGKIEKIAGKAQKKVGEFDHREVAVRLGIGI